MHTDYGRIIKTQLLALVALNLTLLTGCTRPPPPVSSSGSPWRWQTYAGQTLRTDHYLIHTTIADPKINDRLARTLELGMKNYLKLLPNPPTDRRPLECFIFATRREWAEYTIATTGRDAALYLQMVHGGYTINDQFVCYLGSESDTRSIAAHEGFHQFCARRFKTRLCPALEEGLATHFETLDIDHPDQPPRSHVRHAETVRKALAENTFIPLPTLLKLDAGDVVNRSPDLIFVFYGQCWALAEFLSTDPTYQPRFQKFLIDSADGNTGQKRGDDPNAIVEKYLGSLAELDRAYRSHIADLRMPLRE